MKRKDIPIASPCDKNWDTMTPAGRRRFCGACNKHVQDLSKMSASEAQRILAAPPAEGLCVRYLYDEFGNVMFDMVDTSLVPVSQLVRGARLVAASAAIAGIAATLSGCMGAPQVRPPRQMMGEPAAMPAPVATPSAQPPGSAQPIATPDSASTATGNQGGPQK